MNFEVSRNHTMPTENTPLFFKLTWEDDIQVTIVTDSQRMPAITDTINVDTANGGTTKFGNYYW